jgi:hypothetical protein
MNSKMRGIAGLAAKAPLDQRGMPLAKASETADEINRQGLAGPA